MRHLVVYAHPVDTSYGAALRDQVLASLQQAGHEVRLIDLYAEGFDPALSRDERLAYHTPGENEQMVRAHIDQIKWAEALVFVYPTWWYGLPAMLKGWFDRVWVPFVTFSLPESGAIRGLMDNIRRLVIVTTAGSPWWWLKLMGSPGRVTIMRGVRALCHWRCQKIWLAHYKMDHSTEESRAAFLAKVAERLSRR